MTLGLRKVQVSPEPCIQYFWVKLGHEGLDRAEDTFLVMPERIMFR